ncbi:MAG TPA: adenylate/guanylate cyclase domain-containing protein [Dongiaceae bacterium]|nr:adenylate/guanylate cyclase domain-containing protein [Dongiaceae bacterium]
MAEERVQRRLAAILAVDVVGYTRLMEQNEAGTFARLKAHRKEVMEPQIAHHQGRVFKLTGDGLLAEFGSVVEAVACAVGLQDGMAAANAASSADGRMELRIGVNLGDVMVESGDLYGDGVNLAARLQELAAPGGICVSAKVREEVARKLDVGFEDLGERLLKNIAAPVRAYALRSEATPASNSPMPVPPAGRSIVVLPFDNLSGDLEQQYFSDGIAEDIIADLSKVSGLFVIARNSAFTYRGKAAKVQDIGRELGVRFVLQGSVRKAGNRVRIAVQLIDGTTGGHLWAERYDRDLHDIFSVQDEVTREIVSTLAMKLSEGERRRIERRGTDNLEAYDCFLRGRQLQWQRTKEANQEARPLLERAIELDATFTRAYSFLACVHFLDHANQWNALPEESFQKALELAQKAVALDGDDPEAHWVLGLAELSLRHHDRAIEEARKALSLDPNFAWAHSLLGQTLYYAGRSEEAVEPLKAAMRLDPNDQDPFLHHLAMAYFGLGRYEEAAALLKRRIVRKPETDISRVLLAACYGYLDRKPEAQAAWQEALRINPTYSLEYRRNTAPYKDPADFERIVDGLRKAGIQQ